MCFGKVVNAIFSVVESKVKDYPNVLRWWFYGVLQGSILGPFLSSMYINELPKIVNTSGIQMYADNLTLYLTAKKSEDLIVALQLDVDRVAE